MLALDVFPQSVVAGGRVLLPAEAAPIMEAFSPSAQCGAERMDPVAWR